ncbi:MAG TPA: sulfotransferase family 2 domain-containing protein [Candidatus Acidoferrum sp.]|nr:sulfotransferase family 2 domain-containing protein [Candidatus Acidoferrum sp.]
MIICHSRKFIFVHIHKTGGTSFERALDPHLAWNDLILGGSSFGERIQQPYAKKYGLNKHSTVSEIEAICGENLVNCYHTFSFVRDPLSRICSLYNSVATIVHKWAGNQGINLNEVEQRITLRAAKKTPALQWSSTKAFLHSASFSEFIRQKALANAPGFRSQVSCLIGGSNGGLLKAKYFRLEDFPNWMDELIAITGLEISISRENQSDLRLQDAAAVNDDDRSYIRYLFRDDYETFGYGS